MPSPFPGMDPYLESPVWWHNLHNRMMSGIYDALNTLLPANYFALMEERYDIIEQEREIFVEIRRQRDGGSEIVTSVELLSPKNKMAGAGREAYLQKQTAVIESYVRLLEIDLIRAGRSPLLPSREQLTRRMPYDYAISLHRAGVGDEFAVWLRTVCQPLPRTVFVPLADDDADILLDLQEIFERCYDIGRYVSNVDYSVSPAPPPNAEDDTWADALLREKGFRQ